MFLTIDEASCETLLCLADYGKLAETLATEELVDSIFIFNITVRKEEKYSLGQDIKSILKDQIYFILWFLKRISLSSIVRHVYAT